MANLIKRQILFILKAAFAVGLIYLLYSSGHLRLDKLKDLLTPQFCTFAFGLLGLNLLLLNWRWYYLLRSIHFTVTLGQTFALYLIGVFFNHALPSSVGGDVVKAYYLAREEKHRRMDAVMSVLLDRILGLYSLLLIAAVSIVWDFEFVCSHAEVEWMAAACGLLVLAMSLALAVGFSKRLGRWLRVSRILGAHPKLAIFRKVFTSMQLYGEQRFAIAGSILVSVLAQLVAVGFFYAVARALNYNGLPLTAFLFSVPLGFVAMALPVAPAGVGVGQVAFLYLFKAYSADAGDFGAAAVTAFQVATLAWGIVGSVFFVRYKKPAELLAEPA